MNEIERGASELMERKRIREEKESSKNFFKNKNKTKTT